MVVWKAVCQTYVHLASVSHSACLNKVFFIYLCVCGLFIPLKLKLMYMVFKNSILTVEKTQHIFMTVIIQLILFREIATVYSENRTKQIHSVDKLHKY